MPEPITQTPEVTLEVQPKVEETPLLQRVAKFVDENDPSKATVQVPNDFKFDINEIEKIQDPTAKAYAEKAFKSFQRGFNEKFQELAELKKTIKAQGTVTEKWTPERVQTLVNDPEFIQAASVVAGTKNPSGSGVSDEEWSALNTNEKAQLVGMQNEIASLKQSNMTAQKIQQDANLQQSYANYDSQKVDGLLSDMMSNRVQATREHLWKVIDYESAVDRAYRLGRQDERGGVTERAASISAQGIQAQPNQSIQPEKDESNKSFWSRIAQKRLAESKAGSQQRT